MDKHVGTIEETTPEGLQRVFQLDSSFSSWFRPEELQPIQVGTKVLVEVEICRFFQDAMMIAGGWTPLTRILEVTGQPGEQTESTTE